MDVTLRRKHFDWFLGFQIHFELADSSSIPSTDHRAERKGKKHVQKLKINILQHFILVQILKIGIATKNQGNRIGNSRANTVVMENTLNASFVRSLGHA